MEKSVNKHGLRRYIPSNVREKIRKDAGFGCVICGCVLVDYEHIDPSFHDAKVHDPEKMTILCVLCHGRVTRRLISKDLVWKAKANPRALQDGYVHDLLFVNTDGMRINIGNSCSSGTKIILTIYGKPIIWFEPPLVEHEPSKLCAIFYDNNGSVISYINRNQFTALSTNQDVVSKSTGLSIKSNGIECLELVREGGAVFSISKMQGKYLDATVVVNKVGDLDIRHGKSNVTLSRFHVANCGSAIRVGAPPAVVKYKKIALAFCLAINGSTINILNLKNSAVGWCLGDEIFNLHYELVGFVRYGEVFNLVDELVGMLVGSYIVYKEDCYENG